MTKFTATALSVGSILVFSASGRAADTVGKGSADQPVSAEQATFFESKIRPVLAGSCLDCHSGHGATVGLRLDSRSGWLQGSDQRKVIDVDSPEKSVLLQAISAHQPEGVPSMPKKGDKLSEEQVADFTRWVEMGLPWPAHVTLSDEEDPRDHWSFQSVKSPDRSEISGNPIDHFLNQARESAGVSAAPAADRLTLAQRTKLTLTGLPLDADERDAIAEDFRSDEMVHASLVERFLADDSYGEQWARHWMDVARYADSLGYQPNITRLTHFWPHAWSYRDWLIDSFNEDIPIDQSFIYQLAAHEIIDSEGDDRAHLAASGFVSLGRLARQAPDTIDERIDATFRGMMGLTVACARCHDHKFDPISIEEYYSLYGVFSNSMIAQHVVIEDIPDTPAGQRYEKALMEIENAIEKEHGEAIRKALEKDPEAEFNRRRLFNLIGGTRGAGVEWGKKVAKRERLQLASEDREKVAMIWRSTEKPQKQRVFIRGVPSRKGDVVEAAFPAIVSPGGESLTFKQPAKRLELAKAIASPKNPLTARVFVNRVWMWHFGEGLVRSVSDFGLTGEKPDHPELLDFLAQWFMDNGWSTKELHRLILSSETWRQSAQNPGAASYAEIDGDNRLLWRFQPRRKTFEQIRDRILLAADSLDDRIGGPSRDFFTPRNGLYRRSVYGLVDRQDVPLIASNFDFANPAETTGKRQATTVPMQGLFLMNSQFVQKQAEQIARVARRTEDPISSIYESVLGRAPTADEKSLISEFIESKKKTQMDLASQSETGWRFGWGEIHGPDAELSFTQFAVQSEGRRFQPESSFPITKDKRGHVCFGPGLIHPGGSDAHSAIAKWQAPRDVSGSVKGEVFRGKGGLGKGDGVKLRWHHSTKGILKTVHFPASKEKMALTLPAVSLKQGEELALVVAPGPNPTHDSIGWKAIRFQANNGDEWHLRDALTSLPPMSAYASLAQALINSNEFLFVK